MGRWRRRSGSLFRRKSKKALGSDNNSLSETINSDQPRPPSDDDDDDIRSSNSLPARPASSSFDDSVSTHGSSTPKTTNSHQQQQQKQQQQQQQQQQQPSSLDQSMHSINEDKLSENQMINKFERVVVPNHSHDEDSSIGSHSVTAAMNHHPSAIPSSQQRDIKSHSVNFASTDTTHRLPPRPPPPVSSAEKTKKVSFSYSRGTFNTIDKERIRAYMREYKEGAERYLDGGDDPYSDYDPKKAVAKGGTVWIVGHEFLSLTEETLRQPYLFLPDSLGGKQRRALHEMCLDLGLYHASCGPPPSYSKKVPSSHRQMVIAVHPTGLLHAPGFAPPPSIPVRSCRPWFYQRPSPTTTNTTSTATPVKSNLSVTVATFEPSSIVTSHTKTATKTIQNLISHPHNCIRPHDTLDFDHLSTLSLSTIPPPSPTDISSPSPSSRFLLVSTLPAFDAALSEITSSNPPVLAFDMEMWNPSKHTSATCLIQLATPHKSYVVDPLAPHLWSHIPKLRPLFENPSIVKIGHCVGGMDVAALHRDFGIAVTNVFDTYEAAKALKLKKMGLASICEYYGLTDDGRYAALKQAYQRNDWRRRPLEEEMVRYARYDVEYLVRLRLLMMRDLTREAFVGGGGEEDGDEVGSQVAKEALERSFRGIPECESSDDDDDGYFTPTEEDGKEDIPKKRVFNAEDLKKHSGLMKVLANSQRCCLKFWEHKKEIPSKSDALRTVMRREGSRWLPFQTTIYQELFKWRQRVAMQEETMAGMICGTELLVSIALKCPVTVMGLQRVSIFLPELLMDRSTGYVEELLDVVKSVLKKEGEGDRIVQQQTEKREVEPHQKRVINVREAIRAVEKGGSETDLVKGQSRWPSVFTMPFYLRAGAIIGVSGVMFMVMKRRRWK